MTQQQQLPQTKMRVEVHFRSWFRRPIQLDCINIRFTDQGVTLFYDETGHFVYAIQTRKIKEVNRLAIADRIEVVKPELVIPGQ